MNDRQLTPKQSAVIEDLFEGGLDAAAARFVVSEKEILDSSR